MKTTISIDEHLVKEAKKVSLASEINLSALIESALKDMLARRHRKARKVPVRLRTFGGKGLKAGVALDDTASLLDLMEGR